MLDRLKYQACILAFVVLALVGCAHNPVNPVPTTPQAKVLLITDTVGATILTASGELVPLCAAGKINATLCSDIKHYLLGANAANDKVIAKAGSSEPWSQAKGEIADIVASQVITFTVSDQKLQESLNSLKSQLLQILGVQ